MKGTNKNIVVKKIGISTDVSSFEELKDNHVVSQGWPDSRDVSCMYHNERNFSRFFCLIDDYDGAKRCRNAFQNILLNIKPGDIILAFEGRTCRGITEMPENFEYYYDDTVVNYCNCLFPVNWVEIKKVFSDSSKLPVGQFGVSGIEDCKSNVDYIQKKWEEYKKSNRFEVQPNGECNEKLQELQTTKAQRAESSLKYYQNLLKKNVQELMINELVEILRSNKNLILTGAPGTGKTYLAKEIAETIVTKKSANPRDIISEKVEDFVKEFPSNQKVINEREATEQKRLKFINQFPKENLKALTLDKYCIGHGDKSNFCWWIEHGLDAFGKFFPGNSDVYRIYFSRSVNGYVYSSFAKKSKNGGKSDEEVMQEIANALQEDIDKRESSGRFSDSFILKILSVYYPSDFFPINSVTHLSNIITLFGLPQVKGESIIEKNRTVYEFYELICGGKDIKPYEFMRLLYANFNISEGESIASSECELTGETEFVQFHPSFDYTDFVEGLRPNKDNNGNVGFELCDGVFKKFCIKALKNPNKNYVFIIDEINRGEISKIFGEVFFSIDPGYRGVEGAVFTQYANLQKQPNEFDIKINAVNENGHFFVPENVYIVGTMNDIDRSVESMDFAFRRRFAFREIKASENTAMLSVLEESVRNSAIERMKRLNSAIEGIDGLGSAYQIGASYFLKLIEYGNDFSKLWKYHIEGLLREYLRGMSDVEGKMRTLKEAFDYESVQDNRQS